MEERECKAITEAFVNVLQTAEYHLMPIRTDRITSAISPVQISLEPQKMHFKVPKNSQLGDECRDSSADFSVSRILTNHKTKYQPGFIVRAVRKHNENRFQRAQETTYKKSEHLTDNQIEVIARAARNNLGILGLMSASYHDATGFLYSSLGFLSLNYHSQELDHDLWVNVPIIAVPGVLRQIPEDAGLISKIKNRIINRKKIQIDKNWNDDVFKVIWDFAKEYQVPDEEALTHGNYKYDYFYREK